MKTRAILQCRVNRDGTWARRCAGIALGAAALVAAVIPHAALAATTYDFVNFDAPGDIGTFATGINDLGQVVGFGYNSSDIYSGFLRDPVSGSFSTITDPSSSGTFPYGINNAGQVTGQYRNGSFLRNSAGNFTMLSSPNFAVQSINNIGQAAGYFYNGTYEEGSIFNISAGTSTIISLGTNNTYIYGINDGGQVVGSFTDDNFNQEGFLTSVSGEVTFLDGGYIPLGINDAGVVVGETSNGNAFTRSADGTYFVFNDPMVSNGGTEARGINNAGQIVGFYQDATGAHGFIATPEATPASVTVAEPTSLALLSVGLLGSGMARRRRPEL